MRAVLRTWRRERLFALATALLLTLGLPIAIQQGYLDSPTIPPLIVLAAVVLYLAFALTSSRFLEFAAWSQGRAPRGTVAAAIFFVVVLAAGLAKGFVIGLRASEKHLLKLHPSLIAEMLNGAPSPSALATSLEVRFKAQVRTTIVYPNLNPIAPFMVAYRAGSNITISPVAYLIYIQLVNSQTVEGTVDEYWVEISNDPNGLWGRLIPIPLMTTHLFIPNHNANKQQIKLDFPKGFYPTMGAGLSRDALEHCSWLKPSRILDAQLGENIPPHQTMRGWAAFSSIMPPIGFTGFPHWLRIGVRDSDEHVSLSIVPFGFSVLGEAEPQMAELETTGEVSDLRQSPIQWYGLPRQ